MPDGLQSYEEELLDDLLGDLRRPASGVTPDRGR
jgi:hypothetical protein